MRNIKGVSVSSKETASAAKSRLKKRKTSTKACKRIDPDVHAESYPLRISNVVCTAWAGKKLSLRLVQLACQGRLDESVFPSTVSVGRYPATTNSIFDTGRILITGAPSIDYALYAAMLFVDKINTELNEDMQVLNFKVQNIVSSFSLGYPLNIDMFYRDQKTTKIGFSHYDPSLFRGCSWRLKKSGLVFVLFASGRVVLTGARTWDAAHIAYQEALVVLEKYKLSKEYKEYDDSCKRTRLVDIQGEAEPSTELECIS